MCMYSKSEEKICLHTNLHSHYGFIFNHLCCMLQHLTTETYCQHNTGCRLRVVWLHVNCIHTCICHLRYQHYLLSNTFYIIYTYLHITKALKPTDQSNAVANTYYNHSGMLSLLHCVYIILQNTNYWIQQVHCRFYV